MLASIFGFIRDMTWELVVMQMHPFLGVVLLAIACAGVWSAVRLMRR
jgi:hypothetical protein